MPFLSHSRRFSRSLSTRFRCQYHEPGSTAALKAGMQTSSSTPAAVLSRDRTSDSPSMRTKAWRINCSGKEVHALWQFGQPPPCNRLPPTGAHSQPHTSHLTATRERQFSYVPTTVILRFRAFRARTNSGWLFFFIMRSGYAVKRKSRHKPAPVSVRWIGDVSDAPRLNARKRRQDPRRRPAGVSSGSPTSGGS